MNTIIYQRRNSSGTVRSDMALTDDQRGPRAAWLANGRKKIFGSGEGGLEKLAAWLGERGLYRAPDTIKGWEASEQRAPIPSDIVEALEELFGPAPMPKRPVSVEDLIAALAAMVREVLDEVRAIRAAIAPPPMPPRVPDPGTLPEAQAATAAVPPDLGAVEAEFRRASGAAPRRRRKRPA